MTQAAGSFTVASWDESTYQELSGNGKLTKETVTFALSGELAGDATWDAIMCYRANGSATAVAT